MEATEDTGAGPRRYSLWVIGIVVAASVPFLATNWLFSRKPGMSALSFSSKDWKDHPGDPMRYGMVDDLLHEVGLKGKTRVQVHELLGEGDTSPDSWCLGQSTDIPMNSGPPEYLTIEYGTDGRVSRVRYPGDY